MKFFVFLAAAAIADLTNQQRKNRAADACPPKGTMVNWKATKKQSKISFLAADRAWTKVTILNDVDGHDIDANPYVGFLAFSKKWCGVDFVEAVADGRVTYRIHDFGDYYTKQFMFKRPGGKHLAVMNQFHRHTVGDVDLGNEKREQIYLSFAGLDKVNFGNKKVKVCLLRAQLGTMKIDKPEDATKDWSECAAYDKDLGKTYL